MKIYLIGHDDWTWDCYSDMVIVANNKEEVIKLAKDLSADEGEDVWETATITKQGKYTGEKQEPFILLSSFHAG